MIAFPAGVKVWIAGGATDMRRGMNTLALQVQEGLGRDPHAGEIFCFRGRRGNLVKLLWHNGVGMSLYVKRLEAGKFIWPSGSSGEAVQISAAQLGYLLEGIDWRNPRWTQRPARGGINQSMSAQRVGAAFLRGAPIQDGVLGFGRHVGEQRKEPGDVGREITWSPGVEGEASLQM